jgi:flagellin-like protein
MINTKKGISPVVATALLLVVAVVAVVGFQTWFNTYQSGLNAKVEQQSQSGSSLTIQLLKTDGDVYIKNSGVDNVSLVSIDVTGAAGTCADGSYNKTDAAGSTVTVYNASPACTLTAGAVGTVTVVSADGVFSADLIVRN